MSAPSSPCSSRRMKYTFCGIRSQNGSRSRSVVSTDSSSIRANSSIFATAIVRMVLFARFSTSSSESRSPWNSDCGLTQAIRLPQLSIKQTMCASDVPPAFTPRRARPTICVIRTAETVGRVKKTVLVEGRSTPSVKMLTLIKTLSSPRRYASSFSSFSEVFVIAPVEESRTPDTI